MGRKRTEINRLGTLRNTSIETTTVTTNSEEKFFEKMK